MACWPPPPCLLWVAQRWCGGCTADGEVALHTAADGALRLDGQLRPQAVEVASTMAAFNRRSPIAGKASGNTTLSAQGPGVGALAQSLQTRSTLHMAPATVLRFDLNKAVRTLGRDPTGSTTLNSLSGQMETHNTPDGMVTRFTALQARSGILGLSGQATLANRQIDAALAIDLVDGLVGVPLRARRCCPVLAPRWVRGSGPRWESCWGMGHRLPHPRRRPVQGRRMIRCGGVAVSGASGSARRTTGSRQTSRSQFHPAQNHRT